MIEWVLGPFGYHWEYPRPHWPLTDAAQAIEARRAAAPKNDAVHESAVAKGDAP